MRRRSPMFHEIIRALKEQKMGVIVVSTEPETVLSLADRILVMEDGRIAQIGRAEQLAAEGGAYAGLLAAWEGTK